MPASSKMLKNKAQKANRQAGLGDADGRLPSRVKAAEVTGVCEKCRAPIRMTAKNVEAKAHVENKHPGEKFADCFPGAFDPTVATTAAAPAASAVAAPAAAAAAAPVEKKKKKKEDLSFLDASLK